MIYSPKEFGKLVGVCTSTLRNWDKSQKLVAGRYPTGRRYYTDVHLQMVLNDNEDKDSGGNNNEDKRTRGSKVNGL